VTAMLKHIVMWRVAGKDTTSHAHNVVKVKRAFETLRGRIPGLVHLEIGVDSSRTAHASDVLLYAEFESQAALDGYATHAEHLRVKRELGELRIERRHVDYVSD
jgi:hypothetical protein